MNRIIIAITLILILSFSSAEAAATIQTAGVTTQVSVSSTGEQANLDTTDVRISGNGRYVVFTSDATNLVPGDCRNVYLFDRQTGQTSCISISPSGVFGNGYSWSPTINYDGRYIAFGTNANNLIPGANGWEHIYVRDMQTNELVIVDVSSSEVQGNNMSFAVTISDNGRIAAFDSRASNLVANDSNSKDDVFVRDLVAGTTNRVSTSSSAEQSNGDSCLMSISADGRYVVFESLASNLVDGDTNGVGDVFVKDIQSGVTERISVSTSGTQANGSSGTCLPGKISSDGRYVAFPSMASNLVDYDTNGTGDVFIRDRQTGQTILVSVSSSGTQGNLGADTIAISNNGQFVAFSSGSTNLVEGDTNGKNDIFLHNLLTGETTLISLSTGGLQGNKNSSYPSISVDGGVVAFVSDATNFVPGDTNNMQDAFVTDLGSTYKVSGITKLTDGRPLPGVKISDGHGRSAISASDGTYTLLGLPNGTYTIAAEKRGYTIPVATSSISIYGSDLYNLDFVADISDWTLIYYLAGDSGDELSTTYPLIFNQLEAGAGNAGVSVVAMWDQAGEGNSAYYWVKPDDNLSVLANYIDGEDIWPQGELHTGYPATLTVYLDWAMTWFPANHYAVILDDHGSGLGGAMLDTTNGRRMISIDEIQSSMEDVVGDHQKLDVLVMNACLMGLAEDGYEFRTVTDYYVASEDNQTAYAPGYTLTISRIVSGMDSLIVAKAFVDGYADEMEYRNLDYTMSVADLNKALDLRLAVGLLARDLDIDIESNAARIMSIQQNDVRKFPQSYIDLFDFAEIIQSEFTDPAIQNSAQSVMTLIDDEYIVYNRSSFADAHGVSIFFPDNPSSYYNGVLYDFASGTDWGAKSIRAKEILVWGNLLVNIFGVVDPDAEDDPTPPDPVSKAIFYSIFLPAIQR